MADNISVNDSASAAKTIAADDIGGVLHQRVKICAGADGVATDVSSAAPLPVDIGAGAVAHDAVDSGNPLKIGGKALTTAPAAVAASDRVNAWFTEYGQLVTSDYDVEVGSSIGSTGLRDRLMAQRCTILADSLADGLAGFWTSATANGGTATSTGGEGLIQSSTAATGSAQLSSTIVPYFPGQVAWFNSAVRFGDTGSAGNTRRIGVYTVSGTTPQDGFYYELSDTTLNAVVCKAGTPVATASTSWSRVGEAPFTLDVNYHSFEIRYTANTVWFYIDNVLRHKVVGTSASITTTLNFPITIHTVNTSGATNRLLAVRNCGMGRFGNPEQTAVETGLSAVWAAAVGGGTPHDSVDSGNPLKMGGYAKTTAPTAVADGDRVNAWFSPTGALNVVGAVGTNARRNAGTLHRDAVTAPDRLATPTVGTPTAITEAGSTLAAVQYYVTVAAYNRWGASLPATAQTITPTASQAVRVPITQVTGADGYDVFLSTLAGPLWVGRITEAQRATGDRIISTVGVATARAGSTVAGTIDVGIVGTGAASNTIPFAFNNAYTPAGIQVGGGGGTASVSCAGYSRAILHVKLAVSDLRSLPSLTVVPFFQSQVSTGDWFADLSQSVSLLLGEGQPLEQQFAVETNGATAMAVLVSSLSGQGAACSVWVELA